MTCSARCSRLRKQRLERESYARSPANRARQRTNNISAGRRRAIRDRLKTIMHRLDELSNLADDPLRAEVQHVRAILKKTLDE